AANDGVNGVELWKSDGTSAGTVMVKEIASGPYGTYASSYPRSLSNVAGTLFFTADDGIHGRELWKSDGTSDGTAIVKDILPGGDGSIDPNNFPAPTMINVSGTLFFAANDGANGNELWKSDGTNAGTVLVRDLAPGSDPGYQGAYSYYGPFPHS